ncbi:MAG: class I SAM-dependent methyltransferase [Gemmatimonadaceae bacterium]
MPSSPDNPQPRLYSDLARWWPLFSAPGDYEEEAAFYGRLLLENCVRPARTLLEIGSGGGNNASYLKLYFKETVLVDISPGMLEVSRALNPECEHFEGDMRTVRLGRKFDCVFVHDAICYMATGADLRRAIETAFIHCMPGGAAVFAPDHVSETFRTSTDHGGYDGESEGIRYLEWKWDPDPSDSTYTVDYAYVMRSSDGSVNVEHERHIEGLFPRADWVRIISDAGFDASVIPFDHSELEPGSYEVFVGRKGNEREG